MSRRGRVVGLLVLVTVVAAIFLAPSLAFATAGDSPFTAIALPSLPWAQDATGTLLSVVDGGTTYYDNWLWLSLSKGQTVSFTGTAQDEGLFMMLFSRSFSADPDIESDYVAPGVEHMSFMAPKDGSYFVVVDGSQVETYSISAQIVPAVKSKLASLSIPKSAKKNKTFSVSVRVLPRYNSLFAPVKFYVDRKGSNGKFKGYKTFGSKFGNGADSYSVFTQSFSLPKGTFRITAKFADASGVKVAPLVSKAFVVK